MDEQFSPAVTGAATVPLLHGWSLPPPGLPHTLSQCLPWPLSPSWKSKILECRTTKWLHLGYYYCYHYNYYYCIIIYLLPSSLFYIYECFYVTCEILLLAYPGHQCNVLGDKDLTTNSQSNIILRHFCAMYLRKRLGKF